MRRVSSPARCGAALLLMAVSGCAASDAEGVRPMSAPAGLFDCPAAPAPPGGDATQRSVALFIVELHAAHGTCRARLHAARDVFEERSGAR